MLLTEFSSRTPSEWGPRQATAQARGFCPLTGHGRRVDTVQHDREVLLGELLDCQPAPRAVPSRGHPHHIPYEPVSQLRIKALAELAGPDATPDHLGPELLGFSFCLRHVGKPGDLPKMQALALPDQNRRTVPLERPERGGHQLAQYLARRAALIDDTAVFREQFVDIRMQQFIHDRLFGVEMVVQAA